MHFPLEVDWITEAFLRVSWIVAVRKWLELGSPFTWLVPGLGKFKTAGFLLASLSWPFHLEVPHQDLRAAKLLTWKTPEQAAVQEKLAEATWLSLTHLGSRAEALGPHSSHWKSQGPPGFQERGHWFYHLMRGLQKVL